MTLMGLSLTGAAFVWLAAAIAGYGLGFERVWKRCTGIRTPDLFASLGEAGLAGLLVLVSAGIVLHFFIPLSPGLAAVITSVGVILLVAHGRDIRRHFTMINCVFILLCFLTFGLQAQVDTISPDAGIYYIPAILWNGMAPVIPGLANVHGRLGYNNGALILASVLSPPILLWKAAFLLNAVFALFVMVAFFERIRIALGVSGIDRLSTLYGLLMIGGFCAKNFAFNGNLGSLATDFEPFLIACYVGFLLLLSAENHDPRLAAWSTLLATLAVLLKVSAVPLLLGCLVVMLFSRGALSSNRRTTLATLALVVGVLGCWATRGLLLSGCAVYPAVATCVSQLPWTVPTELAINDAQFVLDYARGTVEDPQSVADWFSPLASDLLQNHIGRFLLLLCVSGWVLIVVSYFRGSGKSATGSSWRTGLAPICIGLGWMLFAVLKGPALRFYYGGAFLVAYTFAALGLFQFRDIVAQYPLRRWIPTALCILLTVQASSIGVRYVRAPAKDWPRFEKAEVLRESTDSGLVITVARTEHCWDAPLPCTPYFDRTLKKIPWLDRFYFVGNNTIAYRNGFPARVKSSEATVSK